MDNEQLNNDFEEQFNEQLDNLSEEKPSVKDWELLRDSLKKEGLIKRDSRWRKYLLFFLLPAVIGGVISIPLLTNRYSIDLGFISQERTSNGQNKILTNQANENAVARIAANNKTLPAKKNIFEKANAEELETEAGASENNSNHNVQLLAHRKTKKLPVDAMKENEEVKERKNNAEGANDNSSGVGATSDNTFETAKENSDNETTQAGNNSKEKVNSDSSASAIMLPEEISSDTIPKDTAVVKETLTKSSDSGRKPWVGIFASWDFTSYHLRENSNVLVNEASTVFNSSGIGGEKSLAQYTFGIMGGLRVSKKFALEAGVFYSQKRKLSDVVSSPAGTDAQGDESFSDFAYHYNAKYIEALGRVKYYFLEKKQSFYVTAGATGSFNFPSAKADKGYFERTTFSETAAPQTDIVTLESSSAGLSIVLTAGAEVTLSQRWNLFIEPAYKHALTSVTRHPYYDKIPVEHFWRTFSLGTGLMYKF